MANGPAIATTLLQSPAMADGMTIDGELRGGATWRACCAGGRQVVLKKLPDDCLRDGKLHPSIAQRLARLREVPLTATAHLFGVEPTDVGVVLVREFIPGTPLNDLPPAERSRYGVDARTIVADLHRFGLVHGALGWGNLIVDGQGTLRLTDPSPLLYEDPATDAADLSVLFPSTDADADEQMAARWQWRPLLAAAAVVVIAGVAAWAWVAHTAAGS